MMQKRSIIILLAALLCHMATYAQLPGPLADLMHKIQGNASKEMSCNYKVVLEDAYAGVRTDSLSGRLYSGKNRFIDSNARFYVARSGRWYCKLDRQAHTAAVYNLDQLAAHLKASLSEAPVNTMGITAEMLDDYNGKVSVDTSSKKYYRLHITLQDHYLSYLTLDLERGSYRLLSAALCTDEKNPHDPKYHYRKTYYISQVQYDPGDAAFDLSRIFRAETPGQVVLQPAYAAYRLTQPLLSK